MTSCHVPGWSYSSAPESSVLKLEHQVDKAWQEHSWLSEVMTMFTGRV